MLKITSIKCQYNIFLPAYKNLKWSKICKRSYSDDMSYSGLEKPVKSAGKKFRVQKPDRLNLYKQFSNYWMLIEIDHSWDAGVQIAVKWLYSVIEFNLYAQLEYMICWCEKWLYALFQIILCGGLMGCYSLWDADQKSQ